MKNWIGVRGLQDFFIIKIGPQTKSIVCRKARACTDDLLDATAGLFIEGVSMPFSEETKEHWKQEHSLGKSYDPFLGCQREEDEPLTAPGSVYQAVTVLVGFIGLFLVFIVSLALAVFK